MMNDIDFKSIRMSSKEKEILKSQIQFRQSGQLVKGGARPPEALLKTLEEDMGESEYTGLKATEEH
jgi:hypothetical protein